MTDNQKKANKYLSLIRDTEYDIKNKELELEALRWKASGVKAIRYDTDKIQTSPERYLEMAIADIVEKEHEIEEDKARIEEVKGIAYAIVRRMHKPEQRALIEWFYLNCLSMQDVAKKMYMSERNAYYLKDDALETFGSVLE